MAGRITRFFVAVFFCTRGAFAAEVALFTEPAYVDYVSGSTFADHEASNLEWEIDFRGDPAILIDALDKISSVALSRDTFVIPELENGDLAADLSPAQAADIVSFVDSGGRLVTFLDGNSLSLLNALFGFSLVAATPSTDLSLNLAGATGTPFDDYFANSVPLPDLTSGVSVASLPAGGRAIYVSGDTAGVIAIARGRGWIIALGWDWFNPAPLGDLDGWRAILGNALGFAQRMSESAFISPSLAIPDNTSGGVTSEISDFPWASDPLSAFTRMEVTVGIDHPYTGDLAMTLENDNGTSYQLLNRIGLVDLHLQAGFPLTFTNSGLTSAASAFNDCAATNTVLDANCTRRLVPEQPLPGGPTASFGETWRLTVEDLAPNDIGQLVSWEISALREIPVAGVTVEPPGYLELITSEDGRFDEFTLELNSKPSADVTFNLSSSDVGEGSVFPAAVTLTPGNWNVPQRIVVTGVGDTAMDGNQPYSVVIAPAVSTDDNYNGLDADDIVARNLDDEIDIYEGGNRDDTVDDARVILSTFSGFSQEHTLDNPDDEDWVKFYRDNYVSDYYFGLENLGASVNLVMEVIDTDGSTVLCSVTVAPGEFDELYGGSCPNFNQVAIYYIRVRAEAPFSGVVPQYELGVSVDGAFESRIYGTVTNSVTDEPIEAVVLRAIPSGGGGGSYKLSNLDGNYSIDLFLFSNPLELSIQKPGFVSQTIPFTAPDFSSLNLDVQMVPATPPGITVTPTSGLVTTEAGGTATFTVVLDSQPSANVTINLDSDSPTEGTASPTSLVFTPTDWASPKTVTVTGVDDTEADGAQDYAIAFDSAISADSGYNGIYPDDLWITNLDDDEPGIWVTPSDGLSTTEAGGTATFTVVLNREPTAPVTFPLRSSNRDEGIPSTSSMTFTPENWNTPHTVTVTGVDDDVYDPYRRYWIIVGPATSTDPVYAGLNPPDIGLQNGDNDENAPDYFELGDGDDVLENASFVTVSSQHHTLHSLDDVDWLKFFYERTLLLENRGQEGTIVADIIAVDNDGATNVLCSFEAAPGEEISPDICVGDGLYYIRVRVKDPSSFDSVIPYYVGLTTSGAFEGSISGTVTDSVTHKPVAEVVVAHGLGSGYKVTNGDGRFGVNFNHGDTSPVTLELEKPGYESRTVVVHGGYLPQFYLEVDVELVALPAPHIVVSPVSGLSTTESGGTAAFTVVLDSQPGANVTVDLHSDTPAEGTVSPTSLVFTPTDWDSPKTVTVTGVDDTAVDGDRPYVVILDPAVSTDSRYNGLDPADVSVTNEDDDVPPPGSIVVTPTGGLSTSEGGDTTTFSVVLNSQPDANVTVDLHSDTPAEGTVSPTSLLFTPTDWDSPKTVTVTGVDDAAVDGDRTYSIILDPAVSTDSRYSGFDPADVSVANRDNDVVQTAPDDIVVDFGSLGLWARMNDTSWLKLNNSSPDRVVVGDMDGNGQNDVIADFGSSLGGIYVKRNLGAWSKLHNFSAQALAVGDLDNNGKDDIIINFGGIGLWARMNDASWLKLSNSSPERLVVGDMDGNGADDVIADFEFTLGGLFVKRNLGGWDQLHNDSAQALAIGDLDNDGKDDVIIGFGSLGFWARMNDASWLKLHNSSPEKIASGDVDGNGADDVLATFAGAPGLWAKQNLGGWVSISTTTPEQFGTGDVDASGKPDVIADFGASGGVTGMFVLRNGSGWSKLHNSSPEGFALGQLD